MERVSSRFESIGVGLMVFLFGFCVCVCGYFVFFPNIYRDHSSTLIGHIDSKGFLYHMCSLCGSF